MEKLDYHVTYPTNKEADSGTVEEKIDKKTPVIFLLGWYGCKDKHLAKYSAIYEAEGYATIRYILPHEYIFSRKSRFIKSVGVQVLDAFFDLGLNENPIFFHVFSNGGGYVYRHVTEIVNGPNPGRTSSLKISGILLDSLPAQPTGMSAYRAVVASMPLNQFWIIRFIKSCIAFFVFAMYGVLSLFLWQNSYRMTYFKSMLNDKMPCPQLFLYSKADKIISYKEIQKMISERRQGGYDVREVFWEDSEHVAHFVTHREEYIRSCLEFVKNCVDRLSQENA